MGRRISNRINLPAVLAVGLSVSVLSLISVCFLVNAEQVTRLSVGMDDVSVV